MFSWLNPQALHPKGSFLCFHLCPWFPLLELTKQCRPLYHRYKSSFSLKPRLRNQVLWEASQSTPTSTGLSFLRRSSIQPGTFYGVNTIFKLFCMRTYTSCKLFQGRNLCLITASTSSKKPSSVTRTYYLLISKPEFPPAGSESPGASSCWLLLPRHPALSCRAANTGCNYKLIWMVLCSMPASLL